MPSSSPRDDDDCGGEDDDNADPFLYVPPAEAPDDGTSFLDNNAMLVDDENKQYSLSEKMVHYLGGHVCPEHYISCKAALVFHAGTRTHTLETMSRASKEAAAMVAYKVAIEDLDTSFFKPDAIAFSYTLLGQKINR